MKLKINPFSNDNPMGLKDAAVIALVVAAVTACLGFLDPWTYEMVAAEPVRFVFELVKDIIKTAAATFIGLAGLEQYVKRTKEDAFKTE